MASSTAELTHSIRLARLVWFGSVRSCFASLKMRPISLRWAQDYARHEADARANASKTSIYDMDKREIAEGEWADLKVGDFIQIHNRQVIPADVVIISCKEKGEITEGRAYVETKSLDGETNLKMRRALKCTMNTTNDGLANLNELEVSSKLLQTYIHY